MQLNFLVIFKYKYIVYARVMEFLWFFVFYFVGLMVSSFTLIPVLIILFFGIPLTNKLEKKGLLKKDNGIKRGYTFNIIAFPVVYYGIYWAISHFFPVGTVGFFIGTATPLLFGLGQLGANNWLFQCLISASIHGYLQLILHESALDSIGYEHAYSGLEGRKGVVASLTLRQRL
jgi:hypothetical protein